VSLLYVHYFFVLYITIGMMYKYFLTSFRHKSLTSKGSEMNVDLSECSVGVQTFTESS